MVIQTTEGAAQALIGSAPLTYEKTVAIIGADGETKNVLNWRQYNPKYSKKASGGQDENAGASLPCSDAARQIGGAPLSYKKTVAVKDGEGKTVNVINYRQYNKARAAFEKPGEARAEGSGNRSQE